MSPITQLLISYWHRLPAESPAIRRLNLAATCDDVRSGRSAATALVPFALADVDEEIVFAATATYAESCANGAPDQRQCAIEDTLEWIRRDLAINRGAVFSAVLHTFGPIVNERLASQRLVLTEGEVATICRLLPARPCSNALRFLREWHELLEGCDNEVLRRQCELIRAALERCGRYDRQLAAA
jgi:hypothetical protein